MATNGLIRNYYSRRRGDNLSAALSLFLSLFMVLVALLTSILR